MVSAVLWSFIATEVTMAMKSSMLIESFLSMIERRAAFPNLDILHNNQHVLNGCGISVLISSFL